MPLWLVRDGRIDRASGEGQESPTGLQLFQGVNQPQWIDGISQSREDGGCEYLGEVSAVDMPGISLQPLECIEVVLARPFVRNAAVVDGDYTQH